MILSELNNLYQRLSESGENLVPTRGWTYEKVSWEIDIDQDGTILGLIPLAVVSKGRNKSYILLQVPQHGSRSGTNPKPCFLCDKCEFLLGIGSHNNARDRHQSSIELHQHVLQQTESVAAQAVLYFLSQEVDEAFLESLNAGQFLESGLAVIRLKGDLVYVHERPEIVKAWEAYLEEQDHNRVGVCSVTGETAHLARLFPQVKGIPGAQSSGASLVSFNKESFESYGAKQAYNASISEQAAYDSGEALKYLFHDPLHHVNMGDTSLVFWADRPAEREDMLVFQLFGGTLPAEDANTVEMINAAFSDMKSGRSLSAFNPHTQYFIVGISPNVARLAVRFFHTDTLGSIASSYGQYLRDISMDGQEQSSLRMLLLQTATLGDRKNVPSTLVGPCYTAMLRGNRFPEALLNTVISRMRADHGSNHQWDMGQRASLIKACLLRKWRYGGKKKKEGDLTMALNRNNDDVGYLLGRLFAVMERAQSAGIGETNATIRDRYIGAAAATPARVFPQLFHGLQNSLTAARKRNPGLAIILEKELDEIVGERLLGSNPVPSTLDIDDQGEFYIGYYQERVDLWKPKSKRDSKALDNEDEE